MLIVVRHGRTEANASGRLLGRLDVPLDEVGERQAAQLAASLLATTEPHRPGDLQPAAAHPPDGRDPRAAASRSTSASSSSTTASTTACRCRRPARPVGQLAHRPRLHPAGRRVAGGPAAPGRRRPRRPARRGPHRDHRGGEPRVADQGGGRLGARGWATRSPGGCSSSRPRSPASSSETRARCCSRSTRPVTSGPERDLARNGHRRGASWPIRMERGGTMQISRGEATAAGRDWAGRQSCPLPP